ncbi:calpain family cysteine protease (macronuclear) [Tetrahymena thermophila SB210]|uniref:Calpain family cysteine protease n=1 Tax=Tetrahymena thermophila (strain SB210) TaxID=312017 RepID=A4VD21_TETTS|nr:calpain family cysteine protease [Tetrahymena thermophila SB210]EDK31427.2 calpain family cysteine protease [Tetrahymena thermophila SB210]|eukprot:XP_001470988.2 calpain family cysteine protease [Tetrahymena thermophila SB210]
MFKKINYLIYFFVGTLLILSQYISRAASESTVTDIVFSPFFLANFDLTSQFGTAVTIKMAKQADLVAVACGVVGLIIINGKTDQIQYQKVFEGEAISGLAITQDGKYIMLPHQNKFSIFQYVQNGNSQDLKLISQATYSKGFLQDIILDSTETIAFAYGTLGTLIAYNISDITNPQQIGAYFSDSAQVRRAVIANDNSFLYLADDINGLVLLKIQQVPEFQLIVATTGGSTLWQSWALAITSDKRYAYVIDNWDGIWITDLQNVYDTDEALYPAQINYNLKFWPFASPSVYSALITQDNNYLLVGHRSIGVQIIDISNKLSPVYYQTIPSEAVGFDLRLSQDEQKLYYANAKSIIIFTKAIPNFNNYFPNLHNFQQADIDQLSNINYQWRCNVSEDDKYLYGFFGENGVYIMDYSLDPYHMKFQSKIFPDSISSIDIAAVLNGKYMYVGVADSPYVAYNYDISDPTNPKLIYQVPFDGYKDADGLYISQDKKYLAQCNYSCIILYDISNPAILNVLFEWFPPPTIFGSIKDLCMSYDNKYVIGSVRNWGYFVLDIQDKTTPKLMNTLETSGAEGMIVSLNQKYLYCFDGFRGLLILDIQDLPNLKVISKLQLTGWSNYIQPMYNDQFLIVVDYENGQLSLVDIRDLTNPILMSTYNSKREQALGVCTTLDNKYGFIMTNSGLRTIPLKSDVTIHTQISQVVPQTGAKPLLITLPPDQNLLVGETIQFNFIIIKPIISMAIINVYYYDNYEMKSLPYWMDYTSSSQSLTIKVVKDGLGTNYTQPNLNTVIIQTAVPIKTSSFIYNDQLTGLTTTPQQANLIYEYLISQYLLDSNNFVTSFFDHNQPFSFNIPNLQVSNMERLFQLVKLTLMRGTYYNPILFYIAPSLTLDLNNSTSPIQTKSTQITFTMLVEKTTGLFVKQAFEGVIVSYTDAQNQVKIEGLKDNVNSVISKKLYFSLFANATNKMVNITVEDGVNNNIVQTFIVDQLSFIALNIPTTKGKELQSQVNSQFSDGNVAIEADISISFSKDSFIDPDTPVLIYSLQVSQDGVYIPVASDFFLQLSNTDLKVSGKTTDSQFGNTYYLRIRASDGYSEAFNYFSISVSILPFTYILNLLIKIFGPIIGVFGVYKYKSDILNLVFKQKTFYSTETAQVNCLYRKQITIMGNDLKKAYELYYSFKSKLMQKENLFVQEEREKKIYFHQESANTIKDEDIEKNNQQNIQKFQQTRRLKCMDYEDEFLKKTVYNLQMSPAQRNKTIMEKLFLRKDGSIAMTKMYRDMLQLEVTYTLNGKTYFVKNDIKEFQNKESRFFKCLQGIVARDFIKYDFKALSIYNYLKYYAKKNFQYTENDWYKVYVDIQSTNKKDKYNQQVPFSDIKINEDMINRVFLDLSIHNQKGQKLDSIHSLGINPHIIKQNLYSDALGIVVEAASFIQPCVGESLHLESFQVHSVEAFKEVKDKWCIKLRKCIGLDYMPFGMSKNMNLPHWLKFDIKNGFLILEGTPSYNDIDQLLIRIYDEDFYIVQQFFLNIVDEYNAEQDNFELADDLNISENMNLIINQESQNSLRLAADKNQQKASQFKNYNQNSQRFMDQDSLIYRTSSNNNPMLKSIQQQSPLLIPRDSGQDYVDELFSVQNKEMTSVQTSNRQMIEKEISSYSQKNQQELDKTQADIDVSYTALRNQMDNNYQSKDVERNAPQD